MKCAPDEVRCEARAVVWRVGGARPYEVARLCACCYAAWQRAGIGPLYEPVPTERVALLGCGNRVYR